MTAYSDTILFGPGEYCFTVECPAFPEDLRVEATPGWHCGGCGSVDLSWRIVPLGFTVDLVVRDTPAEVSWAYEI